MIRYEEKAALPALAWLAEVRPETGEVSVVHGPLVETRIGFFFEGAWAGDFERGRPDETEVVFGSGALVDAGGASFVPSLATTDYLFYRRTPSAVFVANSLPLLLAAIGDELDPAFLGYGEVNASILDGIDEHVRVVPTRGGSVSRLLHHNLRVDKDGVREIPKPAPPAFPSYESYAANLASAYAALAGNARDPRRRRPLKIYSTQSRGYDTTAINSIAARHGLDGVFTVTTGKEPGRFADQDERGPDDDGTEIARILGISGVVPLDRRSFARGFSDEIYYHAAMHEPQDANFREISGRIAAPALILTGTLGEMWSTVGAYLRDNPEFVKPGLRRSDLSLHALTETRLRAGYVQAAIPYIGARRREDILKITESSEMAPWRLGKYYDRPIPRRLAESAGVPRSAFGQTKIGSVVEFTPPQLPRDPSLREAFAAYLHDEGLCSRRRQVLFPLVHRLNRMTTFASPTRHGLIHYGRRLASRLAGRELPPKIFWSGLRGSLHCFAVNRVADEYRAHLKSGSAQDILK